MSRLILLLLVSFAVSAPSCVPGDAAVKFKGRFVDRNHRPYQECTFTVKYQGAVIDESKVSGEFQKTVVFHPSSRDPLIVSGSCAAARETYERKIDEMPKTFGEPVDLGDIVLTSGS